MHMKTTIAIDLPHGRIEGILQAPEQAADLVIITNGHNGFYSYGMFPWIQDQLEQAGIGSYSYNFSHGGTIGDGDTFDDLEAYSRNCMRLETADLMGVALHMRKRFPSQRLWLLSHSMGSVPTVFGALELRQMGIPIHGMILLSPVSRLDFWPEELLDRWAESGTITMFNRRTGQDLPHGPEFLAEIRQSSTRWNMERALHQLDVPLLVIHGEEDEAVSPDHGRSLVSWAREAGQAARLQIIPETGHTFGTRHPFEGPDRATETMIQVVVDQILEGLV